MEVPLFLGILIVPAITLAALGVILLEQDRTIAAQRAIEWRDELRLEKVPGYCVPFLLFGD